MSTLAQRRWTAALLRLETSTASALKRSLADHERRILKRVMQEIERAKQSPDPLSTLTMNLSLMAMEVDRIVRDTSAPEVSGELAMSAYIIGAREGRQRVSERIGARALPVADPAAGRKRERDRARVEGARWEEVTGKYVAGVAARAATVDVAGGVNTVRLAIGSALAYRCLVLTRTLGVGSARAGTRDAFVANAVREWRWVTEDDACDYCTALEGEVFPIDVDMESHPNCRCSQEPV